MSIKPAAITAMAAAALMTSASADILRGEVYQVTNDDVYVRMDDSTVARIPIETANFYVNEVASPAARLRTGQNVTVDYVPIYGFQRFYQTDDTDVDLAEGDTIIYEGKLYQVYPNVILQEEIETP